MITNKQRIEMPYGIKKTSPNTYYYFNRNYEVLLDTFSIDEEVLNKFLYRNSTQTTWYFYNDESSPYNNNKKATAVYRKKIDSISPYIHFN